MSVNDKVSNLTVSHMTTQCPHFSPICETWNPAISDKYFVSPPAGEFESVNVVGSIFEGKTANS